MSMVWFTVSKALLMSKVTRIVRLGGLLFKPVVMLFVMLCSAVVVEWNFLKPCWSGLSGKLGVMCVKRIFSRVLTIGESNAIGLYEVLLLGSLLGLGIGTVLDVFQIWGMELLLTEMLYESVRYVSAEFPKCCKCLMFMLSGPVELLFLEFFKAVIVSCCVMLMVGLGSLFTVLLMILVSLFV